MPISHQAVAMSARTLDGLCRLCAFYREKPFLLCANHMIAQRNRRRAGYKARKAMGLCVTPNCAEPRGKYVRCAGCRLVIANYNAARRAAHSS